MQFWRVDALESQLHRAVFARFDPVRPFEFLQQLWLVGSETDGIPVRLLAFDHECAVQDQVSLERAGLRVRAQDEREHRDEGKGDAGHQVILGLFWDSSSEGMGFDWCGSP